MENLMPTDLDTLDATLTEVITRCNIVHNNSKSDVVRKYIKDVIMHAQELKVFLTSPVARVIVGEVRTMPNSAWPLADKPDPELVDDSTP